MRPKDSTSATLPPEESGGFFSNLQPWVPSLWAFSSSTPAAPKPVCHHTELAENRTASLSLPLFRTPTCRKTAATSRGGLAFLTDALFFFMPTSASTRSSATETKSENVATAMVQLQQRIKSSTNKNDIDTLVLEQVNLVEEEIKEHAARRIDLFFYTLMAVYNQQLQIDINPRVLQHGIGSAELGTEVCHSSLFPALTFKRATAWLDYIRQPSPLPTLTGTEFAQTLNITVELPAIVNEFDRQVEKIKQNEALAILRKVSAGVITPVDGMNQFLQTLQDGFNQIDTQSTQTGKIENPKAFKRILELKRVGSFNCAEPPSATSVSYQVRDEYIHMLLRLTSREIFWRHLPYRMDSYYRRIQQEILTVVPEEKSRPASSPRNAG